MGLTNFRGEKPRKADVVVAKNYLNEDELSALNNLVEQYLVFATGQATRRIPMTMNDWISKLDGVLGLNDREILTHVGRVSHKSAKQIAEDVYTQFNEKRIAQKDLLMVILKRVSNRYRGKVCCKIFQHRLIRSRAVLENHPANNDVLRCVATTYWL